MVEKFENLPRTEQIGIFIDTKVGENVGYGQVRSQKRMALYNS
ncbi:hypothetical protein [Caloramator proteoclasticus]|uniref:Uncharacterized protein n=1 Tax=Caloramator proteoclasticus DSM 10124 TaxID=1121262 RepID=A0A1M4ZGU2_9CLOT|nr:hypothetical protein [Caloramator proteoclasticus]SHF17263.1 hypothetical protein SAMN02746091_01924 [Caloramator proteoclasticus DSM 10124]